MSQIPPITSPTTPGNIYQGTPASAQSQRGGAQAPPGKPATPDPSDPSIQLPPMPVSWHAKAMTPGTPEHAQLLQLVAAKAGQSGAGLLANGLNQRAAGMTPQSQTLNRKQQKDKADLLAWAKSGRIPPTVKAPAAKKKVSANSLTSAMPSPGRSGPILRGSALKDIVRTHQQIQKKVQTTSEKLKQANSKIATLQKALQKEELAYKDKSISDTGGYDPLNMANIGKIFAQQNTIASKAMMAQLTAQQHQFASMMKGMTPEQKAAMGPAFALVNQATANLASTYFTDPKTGMTGEQAGIAFDDLIQQLTDATNNAKETQYYIEKSIENGGPVTLIAPSQTGASTSIGASNDPATIAALAGSLSINSTPQSAAAALTANQTYDSLGA